MGDILPFLDPPDCTVMQLIGLTVIYGYVLFFSANLIGDGSELLLLVPSLAGLVGSVVLPVLGAVPDGTMVLFSGLGDRETAQDQVSVGVGALAGSTVMLLTIPWFLAIYAGRVNLENGVPAYKNTPKLKTPDGAGFSWVCFNTGISVGPEIAKNAKLMLLTMLLYLIVQIPATLDGRTLPPNYTIKEMDELNSIVKFPSLIGMAACVLAFFGYLYLQLPDPDGDHDDARADEAANKRVAAIKNGHITLVGALSGLFSMNPNNLLEITTADKNAAKRVILPFFQLYDVNKDGVLSRFEFGKIMSDLREPTSEEDEELLFRSVDVDNSGSIDFDEFLTLMIKYVKLGGKQKIEQMRITNSDVNGIRALQSSLTPAGQALPGTNGATVPIAKTQSSQTPRSQKSSVADEEEEEMPEDLRDLTPEEQQKRIKSRAFQQMAIGTILVLVFSDPAVDVLNEIGVRTGINAFYISFVLAPIASNASELVAAYNYGAKKTQAMMTVSLSTLEGAACMNNTFCLAIFMMLIYFQGLVWIFTAETCCILLCQAMVGFYGLKKVHSVLDATIVLCMFPGSLFVCWAMQNILGIP